ncbi:bestrophin family protein [Rhizobium sp. BR 314]|uniref:bestrophin family protein n=1 Tax=Rhizobium sp. BR 314 TaxID=3040013 RepID=UPI0039BF4A89
MIVRETPNILRLFLEVRGSVIRRIYPRVLIVMVMSAIVVWAHIRDPKLVPLVDGAPFYLIGLTLSIFLGFRNNACYDRWWEGRRLWGHLLARSRDLARQTLILQQHEEPAAAGRERLIRLNIVLVEDLVRHLRYGDRLSQNVETLLSREEQHQLLQSSNSPNYILQLMGECLSRLSGKGYLTDIEFGILDRTVSGMNDVIAGCERLRNTPVPFGYTLLLHRTAYLFCFLLPFGLANMLGPITPLAAGIIAYTFFGLDALGDELEMPFGTMPNDLPIAAIARSIEITLREALGEKELPEMAVPVDSVLL